MKKSSRKAEYFHFTEEQISLLKATLRHKDENAHRFIKRVEWHVPFFLDDLEIDRKNPVPPPSDMRKGFEEAKVIAIELLAKIKALDLRGENREMRTGQYRLSSSTELPESLEKQLNAFVTLANIGQDILPKPSRGRPKKYSEPHFVTNIVFSYAKEFGKLPTKKKESPFYQFVHQVLAYVGHPRTDCSRLISQAIDFVTRGFIPHSRT